MNSPHLSRWTGALALACAALAISPAAPPAHAASRTATVQAAATPAGRPAAQLTRRTERSNAPSALARPASRAGSVVSPWSQLGPINTTGRVRCVARHELYWPIVDVGSDGNGFWEGYGWADAGWLPRAQQLGAGVDQMGIKLVFPEGGGYFERRAIVGTDGSLRYSDDDGETWSPVELNLSSGRTFVPGMTKLLTADRWSNVMYLLTRIYDPSYDDTLFMFELSYDSGASFVEDRLCVTHAADMWGSGNDDGRLVLAEDDGFGNVMVSTASEYDYVWSALTAMVPSAGGSIHPDVTVTAQVSADVLTNIWVMHGNWLYRSTDAGESWQEEREAFPLGGPRGLCASIETPDLLLWTDGGSNPDYYSTTYWSADGGTTAQAFPMDEWGSDYTHMSDHGTNIEALTWNFAAGATVQERRPDGAVTDHAVRADVSGANSPASTQSIEERIYISSGAGVYFLTPGDTLAQRLTGYGMINVELNDVATVENGEVFSTYAASRDYGLLRTYDVDASTCGGYTSVSSSGGDDVSDVVTTYGVNPADFTYWAGFTNDLLVIGGGGPFSGAYAPGAFSGAHHHLIVADPTTPFACYVGSDQLYRLLWDSGTNSVSTSTVVSVLPLAHGGVTGFAIAPSNHARRYLAMTDGTLAWSTNSGATWTIGAGVAPGVMDAAELGRIRMVVNPINPLEAWAVGVGVVRTTDGGANWSLADAGLPPSSTPAFDIAYEGGSTNRVYLAAASGAWRWLGYRWASITDSTVPAVQFRSVEALPGRNVMRFVTWGAGLWDFATGGTLGVATGSPLALELAPRQNPARGASTLDYSLPRAGRVTLELLDVAGRRVTTLLDGTRPAGRGSVGFDAASMGAGVYFARLRSADGIRTTKLVVTR